MYPENFKFTREHEWIEVSGGRGRIGVTHHAQEQLGDVVFVNLPAVGDAVTKGESFGEIESVKAVSDLYAPVSGTVVEVNEALEGEPELVNSDPHGDGWMVVVELSDPGELDDLMGAREYEEFIEKEGE